MSQSIERRSHAKVLDFPPRGTGRDGADVKIAGGRTLCARLGEALVAALERADVQLVQIEHAAITLWWAALLAWPGPTLAVRDGFRSLAVMPEAAWSVVLGALAGAAVYGMYRGSLTIQAWTLFAQSIFFATLAGATMYGTPGSPAPGIYTALAACSALGYLRLRART